MRCVARRLLGSNDGVNWVVIDKVDDFEATSERMKLAFSREIMQRIRFSCGPAVYGDGVAAYPDTYAKTSSSGIEEWTKVPENRNRVVKKGVGIPMKALSANCVY